MMARRRKPRPARRSSLTNTPRSSGPRCSSRSRIDTIVSARTGAPSNVSSPQMPHMPSPGESYLHQRVDRVDAIGPPDLLAFIDAPRVIADRHLDDSSSRKKELPRELGLEVEADAA